MSGSPTHSSPDAPASTSGRLSRRRFLQVAGGAAGAAAVGAGAFEAVRQLGGGVQVSLPSMAVRPSGRVRVFHSRPDLRPSAVSVTGSQKFSRGYLFMDSWPSPNGSQPGPLIVDHQGEPVWFRPVSPGAGFGRPATNFRPFTYRGEPVLAWWEGQETQRGLGKGEAIIVDRSYRQVARVRAARGRQMDLHEFQVTPQGTAVFTCYPETVSADLTSLGGPRRGSVFSSIFQEVDIRTGRLLFEWRDLDHIPVSHCYPSSRTPSGFHNLNYVHLNSVGLTPDGNWLVSGRHTWALYKLDRHTGRVIWRLGGKRSNFEIDPGARFSEQHDARQPSDGTITLFDNVALDLLLSGKRSRGLALKVDEARRKVSVAQAFNHSPPLWASAMGSVQILPDGNVVVGWGTEGYLTEFTSTGSQLSNARALSGIYSYRGLLFPWRGTPARPPDLAAGLSAKTGKTILYASWNGDTETAYWQVHLGSSQRGMQPIGTAQRRGFETAISVGDASGHFAVTALDATGRPLRQSRPVRL